jgi:hypothetical protein
LSTRCCLSRFGKRPFADFAGRHEQTFNKTIVSRRHNITQDDRHEPAQCNRVSPLHLHPPATIAPVSPPCAGRG